MFCSECGGKIGKGKKFCAECGTPVEEETEEIVEEVEEPEEVLKFCPECGSQLEEGKNFCSECGTSLTASKKKTNKKTPVVKERNPKNKKIIIIVIVIVAVLGGLYYYLSGATNPQKIAQSFCEGIQNADADKVYKTLDLPKSDYLTKDKFETIFSDTKTDDIKKCAVEEQTSNDANTKRYRFGAEGYYGFGTLTLNKKQEKQYLFFDKWVIAADEWITTSWTIAVPSGAKLYIEDKEIKTKDSSTDEEDIYIVKNLFKTSYDIEVKHPLMEDYEKKVVPTYRTTVDMELSDDLQEDVEDFLTNAYEVALMGKDYDAVGEFILPAYEEDAKVLLDGMKETVGNTIYGVSDVQYTKVDIESIVISEEELTSNEKVSFKVNYYLVFDYTASGNTYTNRRKYYYLNLEFTKKDNKWLLSDRN